MASADLNSISAMKEKLRAAAWTSCYKRASVVGSVIQATMMVEFEDDLRKGALHRGYWSNFGDCIRPIINSNTFFRCRLVPGLVW